MKRNKFKDILMLVVGNFLLAFAIQYFILPNNVLSGGVAGIAVALEPLIHVNAEVIINALVFVLFVLGAIFLGKRFALKTVVSSILYPIFLWLLNLWITPVPVEPLLASIFGGVVSGIGIGVVFRTGASTGGMDIPPLIIAKHTHTKVSTWILVVDAFTVCLGLITYSLNSVLIGFLSVWVSSYVINKTMIFGGDEAKTVYIISQEYNLILERIHEDLDRGSTLIEARGGYTGESRPIILSVISKNQYPVLEREVLLIDKNAFLIVSDATEVHGEGWSYDYPL